MSWSVVPFLPSLFSLSFLPYCTTNVAFFSFRDYRNAPFCGASVPCLCQGTPLLLWRCCLPIAVCPLCFRAHTSALLKFSHMPTPLFPAWAISVFCPGSECHSVITPFFFFFLQPLSTTGVLSSSSSTSNRSRNRTRYRTKAMNSEVDESLFGAIKVTLRAGCSGARL